MMQFVAWDIREKLEWVVGKKDIIRERPEPLKGCRAIEPARNEISEVWQIENRLRNKIQTVEKDFSLWGHWER